MSRFDLKQILETNDNETLSAETKSKYSYKVYYFSSIQILEDQQTIVGIADSTWSSKIYKEDIITRKGFVEFDDHSSDINTVLVDESRNLLLSSEENKGNGKVMQYNLDTGHLMKEYDALDIGIVISCTQILNLCFFGGDKGMIRIIDTETGDYLLEPIQTSIASIYHMELCLVDSENPQMVLSVDGRDHENSDAKELETDCFNITKLLGRIKPSEEGRLFHDFVQTKLTKTEVRLEATESELEEAKLRRTEAEERLREAQSELQKEREKKDKLIEQTESEIDKLKREDQAQDEEYEALRRELESAKESHRVREAQAQSRIEELEAESGRLRASLRVEQDRHADEREQLTKRIEEQAEDIRRMSQSAEANEAKLDNLGRSADEKQAQIDQMRIEFESEKKRLEEKAEKMLNDLNESRLKRTKLSAELEHAGRLLEMEQKKTERLESENSENKARGDEEQLRRELAEVREEFEKDRQQWMHKMDSEMEMMKKLVSQNEKMRTELADVSNQLNEEKFGGMKRLSECQGKVNGLEAEKKNLEESLEAAQRANSGLKRQLVELQNQQMGSQRVIEELKKEKHSLEVPLIEVKKDIEELEDQNTRLESENNKLIQSVGRLEGEAQMLSQIINEMKSEKKKLKERLRGLHADESQKKSSVTELEMLLAKTRAELEMVREEDARKIKKMKEDEIFLMKQLKAEQFRKKTEEGLKKKVIETYEPTVKKLELENQDLKNKNKHLIELWEKDKLSHLNRCHQNDQILKQLQSDNQQILALLAKMTDQRGHSYLTVKHQSQVTGGISDVLMKRIDTIFKHFFHAWNQIKNINYLNYESTSRFKKIMKKIMLMSNDPYGFRDIGGSHHD